MALFGEFHADEVDELVAASVLGRVVALPDLGQGPSGGALLHHLELAIISDLLTSTEFAMIPVCHPRSFEMAE